MMSQQRQGLLMGWTLSNSSKYVLCVDIWRVTFFAEHAQYVQHGLVECSACCFCCAQLTASPACWVLA
jgi:hypothetical protein